MTSSSETPMSSTISSPSPPRAPTLPRRQVVSGARHAQCTHTTMARLYTKEFRCSFCLQKPPLGWLWRCTQDRELLIEDDLECMRHEHLDNFSIHFPRSETPRKWTPTTRTNAFTLMNEITKDQFREYTTEQVLRILEQRAEVLRVADASSNSANGREVQLGTLPNEMGQSLSATYSVQTNVSKKLWLPEHECQFKCCQNCRPNSRDRGFISLNAILNGDYPPTAVTGFGFHLQAQRRPVIPATLLKNIGLRPSPEPKAPIRSSLVKLEPPTLTSSHTRASAPTHTSSRPRIISHRRSKSEIISSDSSSPFNDEQSADTTFSQPPVANFYDSTAMTRSLNAEVSRSSHGSSSRPISYTPEVIHTLKSVFLGKRYNSEGSKKSTKSPKKELLDPSVRNTNTPPLRSANIDTPFGKAESSQTSRSHRTKRSIEERPHLPRIHTYNTFPEASDTDLHRIDSEPTTPTHKKHHRRHRSRASPESSHSHMRTSSRTTAEGAGVDGGGNANSASGERSSRRTYSRTSVEQAIINEEYAISPLRRSNATGIRSYRRTPSRKSRESAEVEEWVMRTPKTESKPMTSMEEREKREKSFSDEPLVVRDGVAVTEEAVALHVPDVITQF